MAMGGGTFSVQNKTLPGAYANFVSVGNTTLRGERGVVALPLELNWGVENKVVPIKAENFSQVSLKELGYAHTAPELLLVREALKRAGTLLLYRINSGGTKASVTTGGVTVTAKYGGTRGNDLKVAMLTNVDNASNVDVVTYLGGAEMDRQTVGAASGAANLKANSYVTFGTATTLTASAAVSLSGGTNGTVNGTAYSAWLSALEIEAFQTMGYPGTDASVKALVVAFVKRLRDDEGKKIVGVLHQYANADNIGLVSVKNGVVLDDGTAISGDKAVCWVAAASASAKINESLTNIAYDGAVDVDTKYTKSQFEAAIKAGEFVFYADSGKARVLSDINTLTTFTATVSADWTSNRVVRVMDYWANDVARIFGDSYLGIQTNSETGRALFKADLVALGKEYEALDAISDFAMADITVIQGTGRRDVSVHCAIKPNDSMEKLYMTVMVN